MSAKSTVIVPWTTSLLANWTPLVLQTVFSDHATNVIGAQPDQGPYTCLALLNYWNVHQMAASNLGKEEACIIHHFKPALFSAGVIDGQYARSTRSDPAESRRLCKVLLK